MAVLLLICLSSLVFTPPTFAQVETIGGFVLKLARAAGLQTTTAANALQALVTQKVITATLANSLEPQLGFELTKGMLARILGNVLKLPPQAAEAGTQNLVNVLVERGVLAPGSATAAVTTEQVAVVLSNPIVASAMSAAIIPVAVAAAAVPGALPIALGAAAAAGAVAAAASSQRTFHAASP